MWKLDRKRTDFLIPAIIKSLLLDWDRLRTRAFSWMISRLFVEFGEGSRVSPPFRFATLHQVRVGRSVYIAPDCWIHVVAGLGDDRSVKLDIGDHAGIGMGATISAAVSVVLEEYVLLARNVFISDHRHSYEDVSRPVMEQGVCGLAPVTIGRRTWLGQNSVVLPGVTIGEHCIIGANSVVRDSIPAFSVAVGSPAKVVKRFNIDTGRWEKFDS